MVEFEFVRTPSTGSRVQILRHVSAAGALSVLIAAVYGRIAWGMFLGSTDFQAHLNLARYLYKTGRLPAPHFLFHAATALMVATHLAPSFIAAGRSVVVVCYFLLGLTTYGLFWAVFRNLPAGRPAILFFAALATLVAQPVTLNHAYKLGFLWPEPYQIPTSTVLKPFALASFACAAWYLSRRADIEFRLTGLFALVTVIGSLSKPSFIICALPAVGILAVCRIARRLPVSVTALLVGLYIPAGAVLCWQYYETYSTHVEAGMYHDSVMFAPLKFMSFWAKGLFTKFLLSALFPISVLVLGWKRARRDSMLQLAWLCFFFGLFYAYMIAEKINWSAGNFVWSGYITLFTLFVASVIWWLNALMNGRSWRVILCGALFCAHVLSGVRMDWLYLTHYACSLDFGTAEFVCK